MDANVTEAPIGILTTTLEGVIEHANDRALALLEGDEDSCAGHIKEVFPSSVNDTVPAAFPHPTTRVQSEEYYPDVDRWLEVTVVPAEAGTTVYVADQSTRVRVARQTERLETQLDRVSGILELIAEIISDLVSASSRDEIAGTICDRFGASNLYEFAWVGERDLGSDELVVSAVAGRGGRTFEAIEESLDSGDSVPELQVLETGEPAHVQPIGADERTPEDIRRAAFADGLQSLMAIPLVHGERVYGVVGIYAGEESTMSDREFAGFSTLGEIAGFAVNAARQRSMLFADRVVELTTAIADPVDPCWVAARETDAVLEVIGTVPREEGIICYVTVDTHHPEAVVSAFDDHDGTRFVREVARYDDGGTIEIGVERDTPIAAIIRAGGTVRGGTYSADTGRIVIDVSPREDIRQFIETLRGTCDVTVVRKRDRERPIETTTAFRDTLYDRLTDKQEQALRTAFFAAYFESPRESSAEDVAAALDISSPTLLYHLRAAQRKLLEEVFTDAKQHPETESGT